MAATRQDRRTAHLDRARAVSRGDARRGPAEGAGQQPGRPLGAKTRAEDAASRRSPMPPKGPSSFTATRGRLGARFPEQWESTFRLHAAPLLDKPADRITSADVLRCLTPIWNSKPAAGRKARHRISAVFRWCIGRNYRPDNPVDRAVGGAAEGERHRAGATIARFRTRRSGRRSGRSGGWGMGPRRLRCVWN